ncbi:helix-turn-helix domain-containing protein [Rheinheimera sp. MMS21-TC3]
MCRKGWVITQAAARMVGMSRAQISYRLKRRGKASGHEARS